MDNPNQENTIQGSNPASQAVSPLDPTQTSPQVTEPVQASTSQPQQPATQAEPIHSFVAEDPVIKPTQPFSPSQAPNISNPTVPSGKDGSSTMLLALATVLAFVVFGIVFYMFVLKKESTSPAVSQVPVVQPTSNPTPTSSLSQEEQDINAVDVGDIEEELAPIEGDLQEL